ncbi:hypothetical protein [Streptomyces sp. NPDC005953]|uniref:hypothetical protein n=1 Tax=Streptomyces sp. NPDC005953 TaxID=3156719 RepID=UPI0033D8E8AF
MSTMPTPPERTPAVEAVETPPHPAGDAPRTHVYPGNSQPALWVYAEGRWRWATVQARQTYRDGRVVYLVNLTLTGVDGIEGVYARSYAWGQDALEVAHMP